MRDRMEFVIERTRGRREQEQDAHPCKCVTCVCTSACAGVGAGSHASSSLKGWRTDLWRQIRKNLLAPYVFLSRSVLRVHVIVPVRAAVRRRKRVSAIVPRSPRGSRWCHLRDFRSRSDLSDTDSIATDGNDRQMKIEDRRLALTWYRTDKIYASVIIRPHESPLIKRGSG